MKKFEIPEHFQSSFTGLLKVTRRMLDPRKKDWSPTEIAAGSLTFVFPRHMGFCYGVENAIEIAFKAVNENPTRRIFLLGEMIHNPAVNEDLLALGVQFMMDTAGNHLLDWNTLTSEDIVITPAFGTTLEIESQLQSLGVDVKKYNTTCPFVEKVWKRSSEIGKEGYTIVIHGKYKHEETRATFSHAQQSSKSIIIRDMKEAGWLAEWIEGKMDLPTFNERFAGRFSEGFDPIQDLKRIGVVNQTTMLATETEEIVQYLKTIMQKVHGDHSFADTRDTLCYATNENQVAALELLSSGAEVAFVIGGHKSSNTYQLATILSQKMTTYFIENASAITSEGIWCMDLPSMSIGKIEAFSNGFSWKRICVASGASCPDTLVDEVVFKLSELSGEDLQPNLWLEQWQNKLPKKEA
jgi:4-hydroxy-3-methylbut-2-en-1-yl diphosphate reductase